MGDEKDTPLRELTIIVYHFNNARRFPLRLVEAVKGSVDSSAVKYRDLDFAKLWRLAVDAYSLSEKLRRRRRYCT